MGKYVANLKYARVWSVELEADSQEEAEESAQAWADYEDSVLDINERECVVLVGVEEAEVNA
jgi:hypothetical protein